MCVECRGFDKLSEAGQLLGDSASLLKVAGTLAGGRTDEQASSGTSSLGV